MSRIPPTEFGTELVTLMREVLEEAVGRIDAEHRTPATKAKMAERIVRTASNGVRQGTGLLVLDLSGDRIRAMTRFERSVLPSFGLPPSLPA